MGKAATDFIREAKRLGSERGRANQALSQSRSWLKVAEARLRLGVVEALAAGLLLETWDDDSPVFLRVRGKDGNEAAGFEELGGNVHDFVVDLNAYGWIRPFLPAAGEREDAGRLWEASPASVIEMLSEYRNSLHHALERALPLGLRHMLQAAEDIWPNETYPAPPAEEGAAT